MILQWQAKWIACHCMLCNCWKFLFDYFQSFENSFLKKRDKIFPEIMAAPDPMIKLFAAVNNNKLKFIDNLRKAVAIKHQKCFYMGWNKTWNDNYGQMGGRWIEKLRDRDVNGIFMISTLLIGQQKSKLEITQKNKNLNW